jgi:hypothetical protein
MQQDQPNPRPGRRATTQTIEQIEAQAEAVRQAEEDVMVDLAAWLRAAAVELPVESKLPVKLAKTASNIDLYTGRGSAYPALGLWHVDEVINDRNRQEAEGLLERLAMALGRTVS